MGHVQRDEIHRERQREEEGRGMVRDRYREGKRKRIDTHRETKRGGRGMVRDR